MNRLRKTFSAANVVMRCTATLALFLAVAPVAAPNAQAPIPDRSD